MSLSFSDAITCICTGWLKQPTLISNSFGVRRSRSGFQHGWVSHCGEKPHSWVPDGPLLHTSSCGGE